MKKCFLAILALTAMTGCGHNLSVMSSDGIMGTGRASSGSGSGSVEVTIESRTYRGTWVAATGGSFGFGDAFSSFSGMAGHKAISGNGFASFSAMTIDASSSGNALLRSVDGKTLRCRFVFGGMSGAGYGECLDSADKHFDLQIM